MAVGTGTPGVRNHLVTIQQLTQIKGGSGRPVESWTTLTRAWMERVEVNRRAEAERLTDAQLAARSDVSWVMPYQRNMDPELLGIPKVRRLVYQGRIYDITAAVPRGVHDKIELFTMAKAN